MNDMCNRMEGLDDVEALRQMLGVRDEEAIAEADRASILAEPLFEPEGEEATSPEGGVASSSTGASAPPPLGLVRRCVVPHRARAMAAPPRAPLRH